MPLRHTQTPEEERLSTRMMRTFTGARTGAAPNGHLLVSNNDTVNSDPKQPSEIVEFTKEGEFVKELSVDPSQEDRLGWL